MRMMTPLLRAMLGVVVTAAALVTLAAEPAAKPSAATTRPEKSAVISGKTVLRRDVPYVENAGAQQTLDVYAPAGVSDAPIVVFIHGGEWTKGDKTEVSFKPKFLNENGIVFVSANYRLSGVAKHPAQVNDVAAAVRWVRDHAGEFGGSPRKIVLMGHSAGCHLVTLAALDPRVLAGVGMKASDLAGVVSWSGGAFDLVEKVAAGGMYKEYIQANFGESESGWRDASPMAHAGDEKPAVPFLFASAGEGNPASVLAAEKMVGLINAAGGRARAVLLKGKDHQHADHEVGMPGDETGEALMGFVGECVEGR